MGVFNFIETFFFISLGITFILILLLVYHFKQRLSAVEQKGDTMFDIMNNMVKEMGVIKTLVLQRAMASVAPPSMPFPFQNMGQGQGQPINHMFSQMSNGPSNELKPVLEEDDESDESSTSSSSLGDNDSDDENSDDDETSDDSDDENSDDENNYKKVDTDDNIKVIVSDDDNTLSDDSTVNLEIIMQEPDLNITTINIEPLEVANLEIDESLANLDGDDDKSTVSEITNNPDLEEPDVQPIVPETTVEPPNPEIAQTVSSDDYRKYGLSALKSLVLAKGLATDVSKMKKPALLELLGVSK